MKPQDFDVRQRGQTPRQRRQAARRNRERIAAGDDHLPDFLVFGEIGEGRVERRVVEDPLRSRADAGAAKTEAAIDRADAGEFEQHAVGIAMDQSLDRLMGAIADRVGVFLGQEPQFVGARQELAADGIVWARDQAGDRFRQRDAVARRDLRQDGRIAGLNEPGRDQIVDASSKTLSLMPSPPAPRSPDRWFRHGSPASPAGRGPARCRSRAA